MDQLPFNKLSPAEAERLDILAEECSEVIKCCCKIKRHGYESVDPTGKEVGTNREQLETEVGQVAATIHLMVKAGDLDDMSCGQSCESKINKFQAGTYLHHQ